MEAGWDVSRAEQNYQTLIKMGDGVEVPAGHRVRQAIQQVHVDLRRHVPLPHEDVRHHAAPDRRGVGEKPRALGAQPFSQFRKSFTIDEILAAPPITYPLTLPMCAPLSDGSAAAIVCTEEGLKRIGADKSRCIKVAASVIRSFSNRRYDQPELNLGRLAANQAYEIAGLGPQDMHVAEVHDAAAMGEIIQAENLGFVPLGEGGPAAERGEFSLGGRMPINPSGGLESKGHPLAPPASASCTNWSPSCAVKPARARCQGARHAIQENGGGMIGVEEAAVAIHILSK